MGKDNWQEKYIRDFYADRIQQPFSFDKDQREYVYCPRHTYLDRIHLGGDPEFCEKCVAQAETLIASLPAYFNGERERGKWMSYDRRLALLEEWLAQGYFERPNDPETPRKFSSDGIPTIPVPLYRKLLGALLGKPASNYTKALMPNPMWQADILEQFKREYKRRMHQSYPLWFGENPLVQCDEREDFLLWLYKRRWITASMVREKFPRYGAPTLEYLFEKGALAHITKSFEVDGTWVDKFVIPSEDPDDDRNIFWDVSDETVYEPINSKLRFFRRGTDELPVNPDKYLKNANSYYWVSVTLCQYDSHDMDARKQWVEALVETEFGKTEHISVRDVTVGRSWGSGRGPYVYVMDVRVWDEHGNMTPEFEWVVEEFGKDSKDGSLNIPLDYYNSEEYYEAVSEAINEAFQEALRSMEQDSELLNIPGDELEQFAYNLENFLANEGYKLGLEDTFEVDEQGAVSGVTHADLFAGILLNPEFHKYVNTEDDRRFVVVNGLRHESVGWEYGDELLEEIQKRVKEMVDLTSVVTDVDVWEKGEDGKNVKKTVQQQPLYDMDILLGNLPEWDTLSANPLKSTVIARIKRNETEPVRYTITDREVTLSIYRVVIQPNFPPTEIDGSQPTLIPA